jgi:hypothetical protein
MFFKNFHGMIAETGVEIIQFAGRGIIGAQLKKARFFFSGKAGGEGQGDGQEQQYQFHGRIGVCYPPMRL